MAAIDPFDSVLVVTFGGPGGLDDIRPFLANVLRGRRVAPARVEEVAHHYEMFGGVSPLTAITNRQARGLEERLADRSCGCPYTWACATGTHSLRIHFAACQPMAPPRGGSHPRASPLVLQLRQYRQNVIDARAELVSAGLPSIGVTYVGDWHLHPKFIEANTAACPRGNRAPAGSRARQGPARIHRSQRAGLDGRRREIR